MKNSIFVTMILGTIGGILFALGMCMALIPEWNAFQPGVIMGVAGIAVLFIMVLIWRKMENKEPPIPTILISVPSFVLIIYVPWICNCHQSGYITVPYKE